MFIGRKQELAALERLYSREKFEFAVIYGRRRVGKTELIKKFIGGKRAIFFTGIESNAKQNLENLSRSIMEYEGKAAAEVSFSSFQAALEHVFRLSEKERLILVIDEYPYVARASQSLASTLQLLIDRYKASSGLLLILCGSSMSYMEDKVLAYKAPLYGRRTMQMKILPFDFSEACQCLEGLSDEDKAITYGIVGGTPQYLLQMNWGSVEENIKNTFLSPMSFLYEEPVNLLKQEVREPAVYTSVISAIAAGASRMSEIAGKVGEDTNVCAAYLKNLVNLGIIRKETPYGEKSSRRSVYALEDNMFRFWYRFVPENSSLIARGAADMVYKRIEPLLPAYMGGVFEEICRQYLWKQLLAGNCRAAFASMGRWWGTDPSTRKQIEIDIMGEQDKNTAVFCECKWTNEKVDTGVLETLFSRSRIFGYTDVCYYLFARSGFTGGCREEAARRGNVWLVSFEDIMRSI